MFADLFSGTALTLSTLVTLLSMAYLSPCCRWPIGNLAVDGLSTIPSICGLAPVAASTVATPVTDSPSTAPAAFVGCCVLCFYYYPCFSCCCCCCCCGCYCCWNVDCFVHARHVICGWNVNCFVHARHVICGRTSEIDDSLKRTWALYWAATRPECETYCPHDEVRSSSCSRK